jgi:CRISPR-associated protein Cas4
MNKIEGLRYIDGVLAFPISWLHKKGFCEYQLYLEKIKGIRVEATHEMLLGKLIHEEKERAFLEEAKIEIDVASALKLSIETGVSFIAREFKTESKRYGIYGEIDEVQIHPDKVLIIDDKPGEKVYSGLKKQVRAYAVSFLDQYKPERDVFCVLRNRDNGFVFWEEKFDESCLRDVLKDIIEIHELIRDVRIPEATINMKKCAKCAFREVCDKRLV